MRSTKILYWTFTGLLAGLMLAASVPDVLQIPGAVAIIMHLGYPVYLLPFLGAAKIFGVVALVTPRFARIKEWAYAGIVFDLVGALYSHASVGDAPSQWMPAFIGLTLTAGSCFFFRRRFAQLVGVYQVPA